MKKALICVVLLTSVAGIISAQKCTVKKGYAFERSSLSGTPPRKVLDESGNQVERPMKNNTTYFIYMEVKRKREIQPTKMWIDGKGFTVIAEQVKSPVVINYDQPRTNPDTLIKQTANKIFRLQPTSELAGAPTVRLSKKNRDAKIIVEYTRNSKTYYHAIKDIRKLPPLVLQ